MSVEWIRNSVFTLVSGVVTDIASQALTERRVNTTGYLDPTPYDPFSGTRSATAAPIQRESPDIPAASGAREDLRDTVKRPADDPESSGGIAAPNLLSDRPAKRVRLPDSAPPRAPALQNSAGSSASSSVGNNASVPAGPEQPRRTYRPVPWTEDELNILREGRERGEKWETIHQVSSSASICQEP